MPAIIAAWHRRRSGRRISNALAASSDRGGAPERKPVNEFETMGLCEPLLKAIREAQYTEPTEIQQKAIPVALSGRDLIGCAQTGSGKTAAFLLPALQRWYLAREERPQLLVLAPTRELTTQIETQMRFFGRHLKVKCVAVLGGASMNRQIQALKGG